jgi:hypothetical protein
MLHVATNMNRAEKLLPQCAVFQHWQAIVEECGIVQGIWLKGKVHCLRLASTSVQQLFALALQEVADGALGNAILEVSVYATGGELLALFVACLLECIVGKPTVVAVVMLNFYAMLGGKGLKGAFGSDGFN